MRYKKKGTSNAGRPKIQWTDKDYKTLEGLCAIHATNDEIKTVLNLSYETIDRLCEEHYKDENGKPMNFSTVKEKYQSQGKISLRRLQFQHAEKSAAMAIFLGKQYLGQKDQIETNAPDPVINISVSAATAEDINDD
ncbi:MAG: hypothetical protein ACI4XP_03150 [Acutalibacteraceae bacterium]